MSVIQTDSGMSPFSWPSHDPWRDLSPAEGPEGLEIQRQLATIPFGILKQVTFPSLLFPIFTLLPHFTRWLGPQRTTGVRPLERFGEHPIEVSDEVQQFITQIFHRCERTTPDHLPHDHPEDRFDLVQPRTVLGRIHEPNPVALLRQERLPARHRFQHPTHSLLPQRLLDPARLATFRTNVSEQWMFKLSTTKIHEAFGSVATVCSMWLAKSASVRVGPIVGAINSPVVTWKLPIRVNVPCRVYSNSIFSHCPKVIGRLGRCVQRLNARHLVAADRVRPVVLLQRGPSR